MVKIADYYNIDVGGKRAKETVKANLKVNLLKINVLKLRLSQQVSAFNSGSQYWLDIRTAEFLMLCMQLEKERDFAVAKMW